MELEDMGEKSAVILQSSKKLLDKKNILDVNY